MISQLAITNFKAFATLELECRDLTVLTGLNSGGKSSAIQALLLAHTAAISTATGVPLNGPFGLALGEALDVLYSAATDQMIAVRVARPEGDIRLSFQVPDERATSLDIADRFTPEHASSHIVGTYLCAERLGPRDLAEVASSSDPRSVGHQGQFVAHVLATPGTAVREVLRHPTTLALSLGASLLAQTQAWLSSIVRPTLLDARWIPGTNAATVRFKSPDIVSEWTRPANVGFGYSYALPVIVAALTAAPDSVFVVENPEAHLHPAAQSAMGQFLGLVAASGVQVIVETHSDHVINGFRLFASGRAGFNNACIFHFFGRQGRHSPITMSPTGGLSDWPAGFFDQAEVDLAALSRIKRRV